MPAVVASTEAYAKVMLHCYKYQSQPVLGVLVGKRILGAQGSSDCYVTDAYPLFHALPMTAPHPMLEVAYAHCQSAAKPAGLSLLGVYVANERLDDHTISKELTRPVLEFFASRLGLAGSGARERLIVWFVDNESMTSPPTALAVTSFTFEPGLYEGSEGGPATTSGVPRPVECAPATAAAPPLTPLSFGKWNSDTLAPEATVPAEAAIETVTNALDAFAQYRLVDLEDHLEAPEVNYLDQPLQSLVARK